MYTIKSTVGKLIYKCLFLMFIFFLIINYNIGIKNVDTIKTFAVQMNLSNISKDEIVKLIKTQSKKSNYYFDTLSYELINLDNDSDLEIVAKIIRGVHIGDFYIFDKNKYGKYSLVAEKDWKVETLDLNNYYIIDGEKFVLQSKNKCVHIPY